MVVAGVASSVASVMVGSQIRTATLPRLPLMVQGLFAIVAILQQRIDFLVCG